MHNKVFIADFHLDVIAAGAVVDSLSQPFDQYWNSIAAAPASALPVKASDSRLQRATQFLQQFRTQQLDSDYGRALTAADPIPKLLAGNTPGSSHTPTSSSTRRRKCSNAASRHPSR